MTDSFLALLAFAALPRLFRGEELVMQLYPRAAGCWLLLGPPYRTCRLPVVSEGLCRWHVAFAEEKA
jgi:hypothetical protein